MTPNNPIGWDHLNHGGLLLDPQRLQKIKEYEPEALPAFLEQKLQRQRTVLLGDDANPSSFVTFILDDICGFTAETGIWHRGSGVPTKWGRINITRETVKPNHLWLGLGENGGVLPVFIDKEKRIGVGRSRRTIRQVLQWLRAGPEQLAVVTNGNQWRLIFAGLDFDAWCEWDVERWFAEGKLSIQVIALRTLLSPKLWTPTDIDRPSPLLQAILDSRKGQAELSLVLGERVRQAVEILVQSHGASLKEYCHNVNPPDIYGAAVRIVMRMVVVLFAESRDLLPRNEDLYHSSYGLAGLFEALEKAGARGRNHLSRSESGWPRVLALFRLVHEGSYHPNLIVHAYGGGLFAPGDRNSSDGLSRALSVFETACFEPNHETLPDSKLHRILALITRTQVKIRQGRSRIKIQIPIDFSDLSSEYIGILYEGLLDFELKIAPPEEAMIFLAIGNQPVLPLNRLKVMDDKSLKNLLEKSKGTRTNDNMEAEDEASRNLEEGEAEEQDTENGFDASNDDEAPEDRANTDERHSYRAEAEEWACHAVKVGNLVRKPRGRMTPEKCREYNHAVVRKAHQLVERIVLPGEWYLVRWGGTRKGSGTFYTRPSLAMPTVQRTLRPLVCNPPIDDNGKPDHDAPPDKWTPKRPEEILELKVCDPACGSGSFPVAALRFLTDTLYTSLHCHERIAARDDRSIITLLTGRKAPEEHLCEERLPCRPEDELFEPRLKAVLRRHVVERCVYGVDLDPLAVDLCRLTLWIETMDRTLPFSFLDHKIKCGNSLIGAWFNQFQHYPVMAWKNRESGDKDHSNGVHFQKNVRTKAIKAFVQSTLTPDLNNFLADRPLISENTQEKALAVHDSALATLSRLHDLPIQNSAERARVYRDEVVDTDAYHSLKEAMDIWCACWFWSAEQLEHAPLPSTLAEPHKDTRDIAAEVAAEKGFFHWELEFPDVFQTANTGFNAVLGNPPWDSVEPKSHEFFSNIDPLYRSYGKQEALHHQTNYFRNVEATEREWLTYIADFRAQTNFVNYSARPFGDPIESSTGTGRFSIRRSRRENEILHNQWRGRRAKSIGYADHAHSFRYQGSGKINLYKLFLEQAHALLQDGGRLGFIVPSGLYSDHGTSALRQLFLERCRWEWMFNFINSGKIFPSIHSNFKFNVIIVQKNETTKAIRTGFLRKQLEDWERAENLTTLYRYEWIERFSSQSKTILEIQSQRDLEILDMIYANSVFLGDQSPEGWHISHAQEFNLTSDSKLFRQRTEWEKQGYRPDEYSRWLKGDWRPLDELWGELGTQLLPPPPPEKQAYMCPATI